MSTPSMRVVGDIAFDTQTRVLVNLADQAQKYLSCHEFRLLELLADGAQAKQTLMERIWGERGIVVSDASYYQLVMRLRHSFEEVGLSRARIRTIPRYGLELIRQLGPPCEQVEAAPPDSSPEGVVESDEMDMAAPEEDTIASIDASPRSFGTSKLPVRPRLGRFVHWVWAGLVVVLAGATCVAAATLHAGRITPTVASRVRLGHSPLPQNVGRAPGQQSGPEKM
ncbi:winged helix-turn-helix domain-containing protein [Burkholderia latens]|uniref:winged helix-turn-helix domain-containing protein n=1 Tax=Burkholderia latens TaxID=488446 RepID=UPI00158D4FF4|nr:winged helix-turn-helix domain-containing protein [Burkholderia latens]